MNLAENERSKIITILILFYGKKKKKECSDNIEYTQEFILLITFYSYRPLHF